MRTLANLVTVVVALLISLVIGEAVIRLMFSGSIVMYPRFVAAVSYDGIILRRQIPKFNFWHTSVDGHWYFQINSQGFRDDHDYAYAKPPGEVRILVLGDSMAEGHEVAQSQTFSKVLEQKLRAHGQDAEVLNTGISGFGTAEELLFLEREGMKYRPDAVVLAFTKTDFLDNVRSALFSVDHAKLVPQHSEYAPGAAAIQAMNSLPGTAWLSQNSYLFSWLVNTVWATAKRSLTRQSTADVPTEETIVTGAISDYERQLCAALLLQMKATTSAAKIPLIFLDVPAASAEVEQGWQSAIPTDFTPSVRAAADVIVSPTDYLAGAAFTPHVPHGYRHIAAATHERIASALLAALENLHVIGP